VRTPAGPSPDGKSEEAAGGAETIVRRLATAAPAPAPADRQGRSGSRGWILLAAAVILIAAAVWWWRGPIVSALPGAAPLYQALGIDLPEPLGGLRITDLHNERRRIDEQEVLIVEGRIQNDSLQTLSLPLLQARLLDEGGAVIASWDILPPVPSLGPGRGVVFSTRRGDVPEKGRIEIRFKTS